MAFYTKICTFQNFPLYGIYAVVQHWLLAVDRDCLAFALLLSLCPCIKFTSIMLQILMLDLDSDVVSQFSAQESISAEELTKVLCRVIFSPFRINFL